MSATPWQCKFCNCHSFILLQMSFNTNRQPKAYSTHKKEATLFLSMICFVWGIIFLYWFWKFRGVNIFWNCLTFQRMPFQSFVLLEHTKHTIIKPPHTLHSRTRNFMFYDVYVYIQTTRKLGVKKVLFVFLFIPINALGAI